MINKPGWTFNYFSPHTTKLHCEYKFSSVYTKCLMIRGLGDCGSSRVVPFSTKVTISTKQLQNTHTHTGDGYSGPSCAFKKGLGGFGDSQSILVSLASSHGVSQPGGELMKVSISSAHLLPPTVQSTKARPGLSATLDSHARDWFVSEKSSVLKLKWQSGEGLLNPEPGCASGEAL